MDVMPLLLYCFQKLCQKLIFLTKIIFRLLPDAYIYNSIPNCYPRMKQ